MNGTTPVPFRRVLKYRLISGPILIVAFLALIWFDEWLGTKLEMQGVALLVLTVLIAPLTAQELCAIVQKKQILANSWVMAVATIFGLVAMFIAPLLAGVSAGNETIAAAIVPGAAVLTFGFSLIFFCRGENTQDVILATAANLLAFVYLGIGLGFYFLIRHEHSAWWIVGIIMTTKMCDSGAYFVGRAIGKHKLIPWLSPGKTWEGLFGGLVTAALVGAGFAALSSSLPNVEDHVVWWVGAVSGIVFGLFGQLGDLAMSTFKRDADIKDSSTILPGLGGLLDVLDSPLLVAPIAYGLLLVV